MSILKRADLAGGSLQQFKNTIHTTQSNYLWLPDGEGQCESISPQNAILSFNWKITFVHQRVNYFWRN